MSFDSVSSRRGGKATYRIYPKEGEKNLLYVSYEVFFVQGKKLGLLLRPNVTQWYLKGSRYDMKIAFASCVKLRWEGITISWVFQPTVPFFSQSC